MAKHATPLLDQLESGPWPSFVSDLMEKVQLPNFDAEIKFIAVEKDIFNVLLGLL